MQLTAARVAVLQMLSDMIIVNESRVGHSRVMQTFNKVPKISFWDVFGKFRYCGSFILYNVENASTSCCNTRYMQACRVAHVLFRCSTFTFTVHVHGVPSRTAGARLQGHPAAALPGAACL